MGRVMDDVMLHCAGKPGCHQTLVYKFWERDEEEGLAENEPRDGWACPVRYEQTKGQIEVEYLDCVYHRYTMRVKSNSGQISQMHNEMEIKVCSLLSS